MHIQELRIHGFRSLRDITWQPGKLNVLIGPNGSGKSNLLRALELLHRATKGGLAEEILQQGGFGSLMWDRQTNQLSWSIRTGYGDDAYAYQLSLRGFAAPNQYRVEIERLTEGAVTLLERQGNEAYIVINDNMTQDVPSKFPEDQSLLSKVDYLGLMNNLSNFGILNFRTSLIEWEIYHELQVHQGTTLRQAPVARLEDKIATDGQNLIPVLHTLYSGNREFKKTVDQSMRAAFGSDYEELVFPPAADQRIQLRIRWKSLKTEQSAADLSDGTLRFLLLVAILANPEPGSLIAIDEPETGLHPSMFPIIAELAAEAAERTQVVLTTHSPQFLDAFKDEPPTTTVAQWDQGETRLSIVDGEELRRWLQEYSLGALFRSGELEALA
ncbi:MAG TPA: AAA family ATPase [Thermoanaerobaculia bacterium]|nr:AAA family ATPase [Thermoanaerobaculia bacterium]